jgi:hypothetical protein
MSEAAPIKVTSLDILALLGLQLAVGILCGVIEALLPFEMPSSSWIGGVSAMTGAMTFGMLKARRHPDGVPPAYRRGLALRVTAIQTVLGLLLFAIALPSSPQLIAAGAWVLIVIPIAAIVCYLCTAWGLGFGVKQAAGMAKKTVKTL